jgi:hypothetical protein
MVFSKQIRVANAMLVHRFDTAMNSRTQNQQYGMTMIGLGLLDDMQPKYGSMRRGIKQRFDGASWKRSLQNPKLSDLNFAERGKG